MPHWICSAVKCTKVCGLSISSVHVIHSINRSRYLWLTKKKYMWKHMKSILNYFWLYKWGKCYCYCYCYCYCNKKKIGGKSFSSSLLFAQVKFSYIVIQKLNQTILKVHGLQAKCLLSTGNVTLRKQLVVRVNDTCRIQAIFHIRDNTYNLLNSLICKFSWPWTQQSFA